MNEVEEVPSASVQRGAFRAGLHVAAVPAQVDGWNGAGRTTLARFSANLLLRPR